MDPNFKGDMRELHRRLRKALLSGFINKWSYDVGMQLLYRMIKAKGTDITFTWRALNTTVVVNGGIAVADPAPPDHFFFYDALHQIEEHLGIVTDVNLERMQERLAEGREKGELHNFTGLPGESSFTVMEDTIVYCTYEPWVGSSLDDDILDFVGGFYENIMYLPKWVCTGVG